MNFRPLGGAEALYSVETEAQRPDSCAKLREGGTKVRVLGLETTAETCYI